MYNAPSGSDLKIFLIDDNQERLNALDQHLRDCPGVGTRRVERAIYMRPPSGLDAIFLILPAAERWRHDPLSREMQILITSQKDREEGFPPYIVTGVNL